MCRRAAQRMMRLCSGRPSSGPRIENRREGTAMYPGLSDADCQVARFHFQQLVDEGQRQQVSAGARPISAVTRVVYGFVRHQIGALLLVAGRRLQVQGVEMVTSENLAPTATGEMGAI